MKAGALAEKAEAPPAPLAPKAPALKGGALAEKAAAADDVGGPELKAWLDELNAGAPALSAGALVNGAAAALKADEPAWGGSGAIIGGKAGLARRSVGDSPLTDGGVTDPSTALMGAHEAEPAGEGPCHLPRPLAGAPSETLLLWPRDTAGAGATCEVRSAERV